MVDLTNAIALASDGVAAGGGRADVGLTAKPIIGVAGSISASMPGPTSARSAAGTTASANVTLGGANVALDTGIDLGGGSLAVTLDAGVDLGGATVDVGLDTGVDLGSGTVDLGLGAGVDVGGASVDLGLDTGVDLGGGTHRSRSRCRR